MSKNYQPLRLFLLIFVGFAPLILYGQNRTTVSGKVTEEGTGSGIPGVNILIKGTGQGTVTDVEGNYSISATNDATLVFSSVGFVTEEIVVGNRSYIDVVLAPDITSLSEVVVVGYGTQERARVTGAISSISAEEINEQPVTSLDQALQGRAAGITVTNTGSPGVNPLVRIRGLGTVGDNNPLYVVDGMPVSGSVQTQGGNGISSSGGLNGINPNDIASIEILKDASAAAIYGSRAANGVIIITTKKGQAGKINVNLDAYYGVQNAWKKLDLLNTEQYLEYAQELLANGGTNPGDDGFPERLNYNGQFATINDLGDFSNINTDWQDEMFRPASIQDYNLSVSGGSENAVFNVSGGYFNQEGIMLGTAFERYSLRANSEFTLGKFKFGETLTLSFSERHNEPYNGGRSQIEHMIKMVPYIPVRNDDYPTTGYRSTDGADGSDPENPVLNAMLRKNIDENMKILGTAYGTFEIVEGLEYKLMLGLDMNFGYNHQFTPIIVSSDQYHLNPTADISQNRVDFISPLISNQLSYSKDFGDHHVDAVAVIERQTSQLRNTGASGETAITSVIDVLNITENPNRQGRRDEYALISYLGRVNYDFAGKYLFSASVRRDGGSRFGSEKWGTFPSVSAGWRLSEENFLSNVNFLSNLKLRGSWGKVGNDKIGNYGYQSTFASGQFYVLGTGGTLVPGLTIRALENPDIQWETTVMTNIGLDIGFMNDQVRASVEYFRNETQDMLLPVPTPPSFGYDVAPTANLGSVLNKGFELTAGYYKYSGDFQWSLSGNISFITNELTDLSQGTSVAGSNFETWNTTQTKEGEPIAYFYGWVVDGIFQSDAEVAAANEIDGDASTPYQVAATSAGDIRFKDINGDGVVNNSDRTNLGHYLPDFSYGLNASANYQNFDISLFIQGVSGNEILNTNLYDLQGMPRLFNAGTAVLDAWTPEEPNTDIPRAVNADPNQNARISSRYIEDGSYLRVKNLSIGYTLPTGLLGDFGNGFIRNLRVYVTAQNLLTITDYSGYDPEIGARPDLSNNPGNATLNSGVDWGQYPQARTFLGGIQIGF